MRTFGEEMLYYVVGLDPRNKNVIPTYFTCGIGDRILLKHQMDHEKNPRILSLNYWLFNGDPCNGLL